MFRCTHAVTDFSLVQLSGSELSPFRPLHWSVWTFWGLSSGIWTKVGPGKHKNASSPSSRCYLSGEVVLWMTFEYEHKVKIEKLTHEFSQFSAFFYCESKRFFPNPSFCVLFRLKLRDQRDRSFLCLLLLAAFFFFIYIGDTCLSVEKEKVQMFLLVVLTFVCACEAIRLLYFISPGGLPVCDFCNFRPKIVLLEFPDRWGWSSCWILTSVLHMTKVGYGCYKVDFQWFDQAVVPASVSSEGKHPETLWGCNYM